MNRNKVMILRNKLLFLIIIILSSSHNLFSIIMKIIEKYFFSWLLYKLDLAEILNSEKHNQNNLLSQNA